VPANMAKSVMQQFIQYGDIRRSILGIGIQDLTPELAEAFNVNLTKGAAVTQILPSSPAQQANLQIGDIITAVNGSDVKNANEVVTTIGFLRVDTKVDIDVVRNNKHLTVHVVLSDPKKRKELIQKIDPFLYGVSLKDFSLLSPVYGQVQGILIVGVEEDSSAWNSDLRPGDVVTSVNQHKVKNIEELRTTIGKNEKTLLLNVIRGPAAIFLVLNKEP
jgi:serine protease Do